MDAKRKAAKKKVLASSKAGSSRPPVDVVDQGSIVRALGDHVNTRMKNIEFDDDLDADLFDERAKMLREEAALASGTVRRATSKLLRPDVFTTPKPAFIPHNRNSITCCCMLDTIVFYGDKSGGLYYFDTREKIATAITPRPTEGVLSVAVSDPREATSARTVLLERSTVENANVPHLAVGLENGTIHVWLVQNNRSGRVQLTHRGILKLHRTGVTGLTFRVATSTLYSCSKDSTVRVWQVAEMAPVDRFFGHTGKVLSISSLRRERAATVGEDRTVRYWKMDTATQVEFAAQDAVVESVAMLTDDVMIAGTTNGKLLAFDAAKKNPIATVMHPHGAGEVGDGTGLEREAMLSSSSSSNANGNTIGAIAVTPYGDLVATGSCDNRVLVWRFSDGKATELETSSSVSASSSSASSKSVPSATTPPPSVGFSLLGELPAVGIINSLTFSSDGSQLLIVTAKEQRFGRWITKREAMNGIVVVPLTKGAAVNLAGMMTTKVVPPAAVRPPIVAATLATKPTMSSIAPSTPSLEEAEDDVEEEEDEEEVEADDNDETAMEQSMFEVGENGQLIFRGINNKADSNTTRMSSSSSSSRSDPNKGKGKSNGNSKAAQKSPSSKTKLLAKKKTPKVLKTLGKSGAKVLGSKRK